MVRRVGRRHALRGRGEGGQMKIGKNGFEIVLSSTARRAGWGGGWYWLPVTYTRIWEQLSVCHWLCFAWGWNRRAKVEGK